MDDCDVVSPSVDDEEDEDVDWLDVDMLPVVVDASACVDELLTLVVVSVEDGEELVDFRSSLELVDGLETDVDD